MEKQSLMKEKEEMESKFTRLYLKMSNFMKIYHEVCVFIFVNCFFLQTNQSFFIRIARWNQCLSFCEVPVIWNSGYLDGGQGRPGCKWFAMLGRDI